MDLDRLTLYQVKQVAGILDWLGYPNDVQITNDNIQVLDAATQLYVKHRNKLEGDNDR